MKLSCRILNLWRLDGIVTTCDTICADFQDLRQGSGPSPNVGNMVVVSQEDCLAFWQMFLLAISFRFSPFVTLDKSIRSKTLFLLLLYLKYFKSIGSVKRKGCDITSWNDVQVDWDGYTIGYYGRIFEARNKAKGGSFEVSSSSFHRKLVKETTFWTCL